MIAYLHGTVRFKTANSIVLDVNGVGYRVHVAGKTLAELEDHLPAELRIHTVIREDDMSLYGFLDQASLEMFELFLTINGVGPKMAMEIFTWPINQIKQAILKQDVGALTKVKGIGKKTAQRIILELKEKLGDTGEVDLNEITPMADDGVDHDVMDALEGLGYKKKDIQRVFRSLKKPLEDQEAMIKYFLKHV
jgi:Holliday junction DNA helicase RuvA